MNEHSREGGSRKIVVRVGRPRVEADVPPALAQAGVTLSELVERHRAGDWGMTDDEWEEEHLNDAAQRGGTVTSVYRLDTGDFIWVTTEGAFTYVILAPRNRRA